MEKSTDHLATLTQWLRESQNIVFFGGAGVSTESGIPDFRSESGVFNTLKKYGESPERLLSHTWFMAHTEQFFKYYKENLLHPEVLPNAAHKALAKLEQMGKLKAIVTQNIDNLHQAAGSANVLELHGSCYRNICMQCGARYDGLDVVLRASGVPRCEKCGGLVKPDVVLYEESLNGDILHAATQALLRADMLIVAGTSLSVYPAAGLISYYRGDKLVLINKSATGYDDQADLLIRDSVGKVLGGAVDAL